MTRATGGSRGSRDAEEDDEKWKTGEVMEDLHLFRDSSGFWTSDWVLQVTVKQHDDKDDGHAGVRVLGHASIGNDARRVPTVALDTQKPAEEVADALATHGVMAGAGDFYAMRTIGAMGCDTDAGVLRLSFVHYTTDAEVSKLMSALDATL